MPDKDVREFSSWKEIASRLGISVRTAQLWEKERALPVRRVPGKRGRVYLRTDELNEWLASADTQPEAERAGVAGRGGALPLPARLAGLAVLLAGVAAGWALLSPGPPKPPASLAIGEDVLIAFAAPGEELWRRELPGLREAPYANDPGRWQPRLEDLDGDGEVEVLMILFTEDTSRTDEILCLAADGSELWRFTPTGTVSTATERFDETFSIANVVTVRRGDRTRGIVYSAHHRIFYPNRIGLLSADGELVSEYWHPGHLGQTTVTLMAHDLDGDGSDELLAGGLSNSRERATLVVLDPEAMSGTSLESRPEYQFEGLATGVEIARAFFARSRLNSLDDRFNTVEGIHLGRDIMHVGVLEALNDPTGPSLMYQLDPDLGVVDVSPTDTFIVRYEQALASGRLDDPLLEEIARLRELASLRPSQP